MAPRYVLFICTWRQNLCLCNKEAYKQTQCYCWNRRTVL